MFDVLSYYLVFDVMYCITYVLTKEVNVECSGIISEIVTLIAEKGTQPQLILSMHGTPHI